MSVEIIGYLRANLESEIHPPRPGDVVDRDYLLELAVAHEAAGFDRVLVPLSSSSPDSLQIAAHVAAHTTRLGFMIAHRPGVVAPTVWARMVATFDCLSGGRAGVHIISGASDAEQRRDGDYLPKADRYRRSAEFMAVLRAIWSSTSPLDHVADFYRFEDSLSVVAPIGPIPIYFGGSSDAAVRAGVAAADVYMLYGLPHRELGVEIARIRRAAEQQGRPVPRIGVNFRLILGETDDAAWARADRIKDVVTERHRSTAIGSATRRAFQGRRRSGRAGHRRAGPDAGRRGLDGDRDAQRRRRDTRGDRRVCDDRRRRARRLP